MISIITLVIILINFSYFGHSKYIPSARYFTSSVINKEDGMYLIGGSDESQNCLSDLIFVKLSGEFSVAETPFELSTNIPTKYCQSSTSLAEGGNKFYVSSTINDIYSFDFKTLQWDTPKITGIFPESRKRFQIVSDKNKNNLYMFGGSNENNKFFNDMNILKTNDSTLSWNSITYPTGSTIPPYWTDFTATMLPTGEIVYVGGRQSAFPSGNTNVTFARMDEIYVFDTTSSSWSKINPGGNAPDSRIGHSAVLGPENGIIIYGGTSSEDGKTPANPDLIVLSVKSKPYQWITPNVKNKPEQRSFHTASIISRYMIIAFGSITEKSVMTNSLNILDLNDPPNFSWTSNYIFIRMNSDTTKLAITPNLAQIIGGTVGGVLVLSFSAFMIYKLCKAWKESREEMRGRQPFGTLS